MAHDIIGDVHGHDGKLRALLAKLGYRERAGAYRHPDGRTAVFVGDLIDRGPGQVETVGIVRRMIDAGSGRSVMGNHELNAIGYATPRRDGVGWLRPHSPDKTAQHAEFLRQVGWESDSHRDMVAWFKTLPPYLDLGGIRICHAWWSPALIEALADGCDQNGCLDEDFLNASFEKGSVEHRVLEGVTKGLEAELPEGYRFTDHTGAERREVRIRWWDEAATTYRKAALVPERHREDIPDLPLPDDVKLGSDGDVPTFLGHYWLRGTPGVQSASVAVLDYGAGLEGPLVAYRWDGESVLDDANLVAV